MSNNRIKKLQQLLNIFFKYASDEKEYDEYGDEITDIDEDDNEEEEFDNDDDDDDDVELIDYKFLDDDDDEPFEDDGDYLYHITYYNRLPSIAANGLLPNMARSIGGAAYDSHSRGGMFLTEADGVNFWYDKAEEFAEYNSDDLYKDKFVPVVIQVLACYFDDIKPDKIGTEDAKVKAWKAQVGVPPRYLKIWTGTSWASITSYSRVDWKSALNVDTDGYCYFKSENPLKPTAF